MAGRAVCQQKQNHRPQLLKRPLRQSEKQAKRQIVKIDVECQKITMSGPTLAQRLAILMSIPAVGEVTTMTPLAGMPKLRNLNDKQAASLRWRVAPKARDSGTFQGKRHIRGGRAQVRQTVYMAALFATRSYAYMKRKAAKGRPDRHHAEDHHPC